MNIPCILYVYVTVCKCACAPATCTAICSAAVHLRLNVQFLRTGACAKRVRDQVRKYVYAGRNPVYHCFLNRGMGLSAIVAMTCEGVIGVYMQ